MRWPLLLLLSSTPAWAAPPAVVAAENMYADLARQLGATNVTAILQNPSQDPHLFEITPSTARTLAAATLIIYNGAGYDPWMRSLLTATGSTPRRVIDVADLLHTGTGANPHLWYDPKTPPLLATILAHALAAADPEQTARYTAKLTTILQSLQPVTAKIAAMRARYTGQAVTATEPVFGLMLTALGLVDRNQAYQRAIMNGTEPSAHDIAAIESDLRGHRVRALIRNSQTDNPASARLVRIAQQNAIPVVAISESEPADTHYQTWLLANLAALDAALSRP